MRFLRRCDPAAFDRLLNRLAMRPIIQSMLFQIGKRGIILFRECLRKEPGHHHLDIVFFGADRRRFRKHRRRALTYLSLGMCAVCETALWLMHNALAMAIYVSYHMAAAVLVASVVGKLGYAVMEHLRLRREKREKNDKE